MSSNPDSKENSGTSSTIYITSKKSSLRLREIATYLERFGECKEIRRFDDGRKAKNRSIKVTFKKAEDAEKVLMCQDHRNLFKTDIVVFSTQPASVDYRAYTGPIDLEQSPICTLNDDCLLHLYSFLDLRSQYILSRLCERFAEVFEAIFKKKHKTFYEWYILTHDVDITFNEYWNLLKDYGHLVESLKLGTFEELYINYVAVNCPNLKSLKIRGNYHDKLPKDFLETIGNLKLINTLHLIKMRVDDDVVQCLSRIDSLQVLCMVDCFPFTGKHFDAFRNLKVLCIPDCIELKERFLHKMCESAPALTLTTLDLTFCHTVSESTFKKIAEHCHNLREISLSTHYCIDHIARVPNLEKLVVLCKHHFADSLFLELVAHAQHKLRVLEILNDQYTMSDVKVECISKLMALEELILKRLEIGNDSLAKLSSLPNLKYFQATDTHQLNNKAIVDFIRAVPNLEKFYIIQNKDHNSLELMSAIIDVLEEKRPALGKPFDLLLQYCGTKKHFKAMQKLIFPNNHLIRYDSDFPLMNHDSTVYEVNEDYDD